MKGREALAYVVGWVALGLVLLDWFPIHPVEAFFGSLLAMIMVKTSLDETPG